jgi:formylglycine-generating enzyme required for sulfatase activity
LVSDADTIAAWTFQEGSGSLLNDVSGNGHDGTIDGATWVEDCPEAPESGPEADYTSPSTDYGMNYIPPGTFEMGCTAEMEPCEADEYPVHDVTLTNGFYIGITEVTQAQWEAVMGENPSDFSACGDDCPVETVSWEDAIAFANALSTLDGLTAAYDESGTVDLYADGYRLPTEAEWEYAARAGDGTAFAGSDVIGEVAWTSENADGTTHPVGRLAPNGLGLYDMSGNVYEWCGDGYDAEYYEVSPATDPTGALSANRVNRGGAWEYTPQNARVANRTGDTPDYRFNRLGLRLARTVPVDADGDGVVAAIDCDDDDPDIGECPEEPCGDSILAAGEVCIETVKNRNGVRWLAQGTWGSATVEAEEFCADEGYAGGGRVVWPADDVDYVYSYNAGKGHPDGIYDGHILPNIQVQREVTCW